MKCLLCGDPYFRLLVFPAGATGTAKYLEEWKCLTLESFCFLFGISSSDHPIISAVISHPNFVSELCAQCVQSVSDAHFVFWQLSQLERKLRELQHHLFHKISVNQERIVAQENSDGNQDEDVKEPPNEMEYNFRVKSLFQEIELGRESWPKESAFSAKWSEALKTSTFPAKILPGNPPNLHEISIAPSDDDKEDDASWNGDNTPNDTDPSDSEWEEPEPVRKRRKPTSTTKVKPKPRKYSILSEDEKVPKPRGKISGKARKFACLDEPNCTRSFTCHSNLFQHVKKFHPHKLFTCDQPNCTSAFIEESRLESHKTIRHGFPGPQRPKKICDICGAKVHYRQMNDHYRLKHLTQEKFTCDRCSMTFSKTEELTAHEQLHLSFLSTLPYTCVMAPCSTIFANSTDLKKHVMREHVTSWVKCHVCGVMKMNKWILRAHFRSIHGKTYVCDQCPKQFNTSSGLRQHKDFAHLGKVYPCSTCGKEYKRANALHCHRQSHLAVKAHRCSLCPKSFARGNQLRLHEATHSGLKNYCCELCGKRFVQVKNLEQHMRSKAHQDHTFTKRPQEMIVPEEKRSSAQLEMHE